LICITYFVVSDLRVRGSDAFLCDLRIIKYRQSTQEIGEDKARKLTDSKLYYKCALTIFEVMFNERWFVIADVHVMILDMS
jgi:hypothetical protein